MLYRDTSIDAKTVWLLMVLRPLHRTQEVAYSTESTNSVKRYYGLLNESMKV